MADARRLYAHLAFSPAVVWESGVARDVWTSDTYARYIKLHAKLGSPNFDIAIAWLENPPWET